MAKQSDDQPINWQMIRQTILNRLRQFSQWVSYASRQTAKGLGNLSHRLLRGGRDLVRQVKEKWPASEQKAAVEDDPPEPSAVSSETVRFDLKHPSADPQVSEQTIAVNSIRNMTATVTEASGSQPARKQKPIRRKTPPIRRRSRQKVYRLKGYTTVAKINRKYQMESQQRFLRQLLLIIGIILALVLLFEMYNPIRDLSEWYRIIGISDLGGLSATDTQMTGN